MCFIIVRGSFIVVRGDLNIFWLFQCVLVFAIPKISISFSTMIAVIVLILSLLFDYIPFAFVNLILVDTGSFV